MAGCVRAFLFVNNVKLRRVLLVTLVMLLFFNNGGVPRLVHKLNGNIHSFGSKVGSSTIRGRSSARGGT